MGLVESWVTSGGETGESNRITLLRDENGDGKPKTRSIFLDHLASPFGVALVGSDLYVANTDAIVRYAYNTGDTKITAVWNDAHAPSRRPDRSPLDQEPGGERRRFAALCRRRLEQQHHRKRNGSGSEPRRHLGGGAVNGSLAHLRERTAQSQRPDIRAGNQSASGPSSTSATNWAPISCRTT